MRLGAALVDVSPSRLDGGIFWEMVAGEVVQHTGNG